MEIKTHWLAPPISFEKFADEHGLAMEVHERSRGPNQPQLARFYARFKGVDVARGVMLESTFGDGDSPIEAIQDEQLRGQRLILDANGPNRKEIQCPNEFA